MAMGRPSSYKPEYCEALIDHMSKGYSFESFAAEVNAHRGTLYDWTHKHPDFADAKKKATDKCLKFWEKLGLAGIAGNIKGFNAAVYIFSMKNRFAWADVKGVDLSVTAPQVNQELMKQFEDIMGEKK